jgi:hypothetical protein
LLVAVLNEILFDLPETQSQCKPNKISIPFLADGRIIRKDPPINFEPITMINEHPKYLYTLIQPANKTFLISFQMNLILPGELRKVKILAYEIGIIQRVNIRYDLGIVLLGV